MADEPENVFLRLLDESHPEQVYQEFLEHDTRFIPREFLQNHGVHLSMVLRKLALARDYSTDFFYLSKSSSSWHCVLIEIEKPQSRYFKDNGNDFHGDFLSGLAQINRWRAWFENTVNFLGFINGTIASIRRPLTINPCRIKYVLVHGRRSEFGDNDIRRGLVTAQQRDDFRIMSYDALAESLHTKLPLYVAARMNEFIEIHSDTLIDEALFAWVDPTVLKICPELKRDIESKRSRWRMLGSTGKLVIEEALPKIGLCS